MIGKFTNLDWYVNPLIIIEMDGARRRLMG